MNRLRAWLVAVSLLFTCGARATDLSDLWWNSSENGWGVNVAQQGDILFLTFFLYGPDRQPYWISGSSVQFQGTDASGNLTYTGQVAQTAGPWFGSTFDPSTVGATVVGNVTFLATSVTTATLTYTVNGVSVTKQLTRLTFRANPQVNGNYIGGVVSDVSSCPQPSNNGHVEGQILVSITGNATNTQIVLQGTGTCNMGGPYVQDGRMGRIAGQISCTNGISGTVSIFEVEANTSTVSARFQGVYNNGCRESGHFGGVRR